MDSFDNATERSLSNGRQTSTFVLDNPFPPLDPISGGKDARLFFMVRVWQGLMKPWLKIAH
jgi:hypothetical protein